MNQRNLLSIIAVIGVLLISGCGDKTDAKQNSSHSVEQQPQKEVVHKTKELISFKGIPIGKPGAKDALKKMCNEFDYGGISENERKTCLFEKERESINLGYGNISVADVWVNLDRDGALNKIEFVYTKAKLLELAIFLEDKYGKPEKIVDTVENGMGTKFEKDTFVWVDDQGSRIIIETMYEKVDRGRLVIESASSIAAQDAAARMATQAVKSNL